LSHGFGIGIALGTQPVGFYLHGLALLFQSGEGRDVEDESAPRQCGGNSGQIASQQLRIEQDEILNLVNIPAIPGGSFNVSAETPLL
jgi:hypothetical protein